MICVYKIANNINNKVYIGASRDFYARKNAHLNLLSRGKHHSIELQELYNTYNLEISFIILEELTDDEQDILSVRERYWLDFYQSYIPKFGYNCAVNPRGSKGISPIAQYTLEGRFIQSFISIILAREWLESIGVSCNSPHKLAYSGGFQWKLVDLDNIPETIDSIAQFYVCYDLDGIKVQVLDSLLDAILFTKSSPKLKSNILRAINNPSNNYKGFYWRNYQSIVDIPSSILILAKGDSSKKVAIYDKNDILVKECKSLGEAAIFLNSIVSNVCRALAKRSCKTHRGYRLEYMDS